MDILFNSDVLYNFATPRAAGDVPKWLVSFCEVAQAKGAAIVIPETTLLELQRIQAEAVGSETERLKQASDLLSKWGAIEDGVDLTGCVPERDLIGELRTKGIDVTVAEPTLEDFRDAHRRACVRAAPHPTPTTAEGAADTSDEMRDLIIWVMALRAAADHGGAVLLSKDRIHIGPAGDAEASAAGLFRVRGSSGALHVLEAETVAERFFRALLLPAWDSIRHAGFPIPPGDAPLHRIRPSYFQRTAEGIEASGSVTVQVTGARMVTINVEASISEDRVLRRVRFDGFVPPLDECPTAVEVAPNVMVEVQIDDYRERVKALKIAMGSI